MSPATGTVTPQRYTVEPVAEGVRLTLSNEAPVSGWMKPMEAVLQRSVQRMFERDVARLKAIIEAEAQAAAGALPSAGERGIR